MGWLTGIGIPALWLFIGFRFAAPIFVKRSMESHVRNWPILSRDLDDMNKYRREAAYFSIPLALVWPAYLVWLGLDTFLPQYVLGHSLLTDHEIRLQNKELQERIAKLEAEERQWKEMLR